MKVNRPDARGEDSAPQQSPSGAVRSWIRDRGSWASPDSGATSALKLVSSGLLDSVPLPGGGATGERFAVLAALGQADCVLARLCEGHLDGLAILKELDGPYVAPGRLIGVWAAQPPGAPPLLAHSGPVGWTLNGRKLYCSGASLCAVALVTALTDSGYRLFLVEIDPESSWPEPGSWAAVGMAASDSRAVNFERAPAEPVGDAGAYLSRPGFWQGGAGVAACWYGAAVAVGARLLTAAGVRELDPHALAHLGAVDCALAGARHALERCADRIDDQPEGAGTTGELVARRVRGVVESAAKETIDRVGRALGAGPLTQDGEHARRVADLEVYLRQSHAERDLAGLGKLLASGDTDPGWAL